MSGLFAGTALERPVTCEVCERPLEDCTCPRDADGAVRRPCDQTADIRCERRRKGKHVTIVRGLDPVANDLPALLKTLRAACGAGGTVNEDGIEVQGDHREKVAEAMRAAGFSVRMRS